MAAELGFEPRQTESETVVLPLHNSAMCESVYHYTEFWGFVKRLQVRFFPSERILCIKISKPIPVRRKAESAGGERESGGAIGNRREAIASRRPYERA